MDRDVVGDLTARNHELEPRLARLSQLCRRAHHDDPSLREPAAQLYGFGDGNDAEGRSPCFQRGSRDVARAVAVPVRLHDGPQLGALEHVEEPDRVVADRAEIYRDLAPMHASSLARMRAHALRPRRSPRGRSVAEPSATPP